MKIGKEKTEIFHLSSQPQNLDQSVRTTAEIDLNLQVSWPYILVLSVPSGSWRWQGMDNIYLNKSSVKLPEFLSPL